MRPTPATHGVCLCLVWLSKLLAALSIPSQALPALSNPGTPGIGEVWIDLEYEKTGSKTKPGTAAVVDATTWKVTRKVALPRINMNNPHNMWASADQSVIYQTQWFDKSVFSIVPAYTARTNPWQYDDLMGPQQYNMDASLVKSFQIVERFRFELRMDVFNVLNNITWNNADANVNSANFGRSANNDQLTLTYGRRAQLGLRLQF